MNTVNIQNAIRLTRVQFPSFNFWASEALNPNLTNEVQVNFGYDIRFFEDEDKIFAVEFNLEFHHAELLKSQVNMVALFETENTISEEFKTSGFVQTNAPAIAFPYLRSFISTMSINAGFSPIILPAVNLTKKASK